MIPIAKPNFIETRAVENPLLKVPPASRGNRTGAVPLAKRGGNLQEGEQLMDFYRAMVRLVFECCESHGWRLANSSVGVATTRF